ncbi:DEAD/DEAH box helicase family protein [Amycolatopsis thermalba]|uniref:DEAD/DEAH box helicase family protein n=1 Tax=Amycolatopsis thermalba TaxID=944492 RepID=A0ABY4P150_9PSEU|nr:MULTISPECIES: DEAD/DEAH box helicase family protein [Amycolatopsis]UQS26067.1 DEAD/DEAH box helicase family protein [Amycolatopsis thermalba]
MSNFGFLQAEWPDLHDEAVRAERNAVADPRAACFYARRTLELAVNWLYRADGTLKLPYHSELAALIAEPTMVNLVGPAIRTKMDVIRRQGNTAVHRPGPVQPKDAVRTVAELFHVLYWIARRYARNQEDLPAAGLTFDQSRIPVPMPEEVRRKKQAEIQAMAEQFARQQEELVKERRKNQDLDAEVAKLRAEIKAAKAANLAQPDTHDYNEADTRKHIIDLLLGEAGWALDKQEDREYPVDGLPTPSGKGRVDYVLWDEDGRPLGLVEAKRTTKDALAGQQQAKAYANALERQFGQRPVIFYTNGYQTFLWDDVDYPPREVQGFYTKDELRLLIQRRTSRLALGGVAINDEIASRYYQSRAIRRIAESFERDKQRQALLVMATGAGKTRTIIALVDLLQRAQWVKRVLFLADRQALVTQAANAFKQHLPGTPTVNLLTEKNIDGRVYVSTYPTMMGLINEMKGGLRRFGPGHFDLVIVDEAHRSVYQKYRTIFEYFDSLLVGLTATPKDEIDRNTYRLFNLEDGVPTDVYGLEEAVAEGYLVKPHTVNVPLKFPQRGIRYDELSEAEKEEWDLVDWDDEDGQPDEISADEVNKFLFNADTIDKMLETLMTYGAHVEGGDRLGKTIIFARNRKHAEFIVQRFDTLYPEHQGGFARIITHDVALAQDLIDKFSMKDSAPHIAVSVDMLDTGIDVPEVLNLVFAKLVRSKTKFWQMIGRGTRLCPDLFGPNNDKQGFLVFDLCRNVEFFNQDIAPAEGRLQPSLRERLFRRRAELLYALDQELPEVPPPNEDQPVDGTQTEVGLRWDLAARLQAEVVGMNPQNIEVRRRLREVETYQDLASWGKITADKRDELAETLAGLPTEFKEDENSEEAKRFDLLVLRLQLGLLQGDPAYDALRHQVQEIAEALLDPTTLNNPVVAKQQELLSDLISDDWWQDVTLPMLESMRRRIRGLVRLIPKIRRGVVYTDFEDELGELTQAELRGITLGTNRSRFETKVRTYLRSHEHELAVQKLLRNRQITAVDLEQLEAVFVESAFGSPEDIAQVKEEYGGLGLFLRSLTGLDYESAAAAFDQFQAGKTLSASQLHFLKLLIDFLAKNGTVDVGALYEPPFTALAPGGPEDIFENAEVNAIQTVLNEVRSRAVPEEKAG